MPNVQLDWQQGTTLAVALTCLAPVLYRRGSVRGYQVAREASLVAALYALWQLAASVSVSRVAGAYERARWIERTEQTWRLPAEQAMQRPLLEHPWLGQLANVYYATMHFGALGVFLAWMFWWHRDRYPSARTALAVFTGVALLVQLIPVAPPRLLDGYVDVASFYGQSVYASGAFGADQVSAMPSVHVGWSVLIGVTAVTVSRSRWRWLVLAHPLLTLGVVVGTGNHWWFDAVIAIALLAAVAALETGISQLSGIRMMRSSEPVASPLPSRLDVVTQSEPSGAAATVRSRP